MTFYLDHSKETFINLHKVREFIYEALFYAGSDSNFTVADLKRLLGCSLDGIDNSDKEIGWDVEGLFAFDFTMNMLSESIMAVEFFPDPKKLQQ